MVATKETVFINGEDGILTNEMVEKAGLAKLALIDNSHVEIVKGQDSQIRTIYYTTKGVGHFYLDDTRYKVYNALTAIPASTKIVVKEVEQPKPVQREEKKEVKKNPVEPGKIRHDEYETIKICIESNIPVMLVGDAGTGKNHTLEEISLDLYGEGKFYFTNSIQQEYKITGFIDAGGTYHETEFYRAFTSGGVFFLDEIDASIPEVLVLLNAAIANRYFEFPTGKVHAHPDFRVVAAGNTVGSGANELYTGRLVLDSATLDRFTVIEFDYDIRVELSLAKGNKDLVNFVRSLRGFCKKMGIRGTFSYRMIQNFVKLEAAGLPLEKIIKIAVVKGLDVDTIKMLKVEDSGKYFYALQKVQKAL